MPATPTSPSDHDHDRQHDADPRLARSRARMLTAATELLVESGVRAVTADAVAERSGVAKSTLYRHWSSVPDLLVDVMRANVPEAVVVDLSGGFEAALRRWIDRAIEALSAPDWAGSLPALIELRAHSPEMAELLAADFDNNLSTVARILELGAAEGRLPAGLDPRQVTHTLIGPLVLAVLTGDETSIGELAGYVVGRFLASYAGPHTT